MENSLKQVRYCDWDVMRGMLYDVFGWYMQNISTIERFAEYENMTPDEFIRQCLSRGMTSYYGQYEGVKSGDEL